MTVDLSEIDQVCAMIPHRTIVEDRGFTVIELATRMGCARTTAMDRLHKLEREGKVRLAGYRSGAHGEKVYELAQ